MTAASKFRQKILKTLQYQTPNSPLQSCKLIGQITTTIAVHPMTLIPPEAKIPIQ